MFSTIPIIYSVNTFYSFDEEYNIVSFNELDKDKQYICYGNFNDIYLNYDNIYDVQAIEYLIDVENKKDDFNIEIISISQYKQYKDNIKECFDQDIIKSALLTLLKISSNNQFIKYCEYYKKYYKEIIQKILYNVDYFSKQKLYINKESFENVKEKFGVSSIQFEEDNIFIKPVLKFYTQKTGRISSNVITLSHDEKKYFKPEYDLLVELDSVASEFRFLLFINKELELYDLSKNNFWSDIINLFDIQVLNEYKIKTALYLILFGASSKTISEKLRLTPGVVEQVRSCFRQYFPNSYQFYMMNVQQNKYMDRDSHIVYDFFGKKIFSQDNYKKISYFLQSSLSTYFQLFIHNILKEFHNNNIQSHILYSIHDSLMLDLQYSEKDKILKIIKEMNNCSDNFRLLLKVKK